MVLLNQAITLNWSGDGSAGITGSIPATGDTLIVANIPLINGNQSAAMAIRAAGLNELYMKSDIAATVTFRDGGGASVGSVALLAGVPWAYAPGHGTTPISDDVATVSVSAAATGTLQVRGIQDGTPAIATAALTGTITSAVESQIVTGGRTIILTLTGANWLPAGAAFDAQRQAIINGLDSAQAEGTGWDAVVRPAFVVSNVVRTSATVVTITTPAAGTYATSVSEVITATIPAPATTALQTIVASPTATIATGS